MQRNFCKHQESQKVLEKPISASAMENEQPIDQPWRSAAAHIYPLISYRSRRTGVAVGSFRRSLGSRRRARAVEDEAGVGRRSAPRASAASGRGSPASGGGRRRRRCAVWIWDRRPRPRGGLSGEEEVAEAAGAREVGCDAGVVLDGGGGRRRRAPPRLGDGREPGTGEPGSGVAAARLSGALVRGWG